ncbi:30S ribosomal S4 domain protein [Rickettsia amblyommatis str. Darkwater]|nr:30S ribosomal S4 domain protein [Rickettsia amblyommatis str. Darkwater]
MIDFDARNVYIYVMQIINNKLRILSVTKIVRSKYKASRRLGVSLWGDSKDAFNTRNYRPGNMGRIP